jgi:quinol monooxygenase YgiN
MVIELMSISIPSSKRHEIGRAMASLVGPTQAEPGCLSCGLYQNWTNPDELRFEGRWETWDDLVRHLQSDIYKKFLLLMELSLAPPVLDFYMVSEIKGLNLVNEARNEPA